MTKWEKILGGYATGTLTGEERASLMRAALSDQTLFDLLMDEEALRETLADPATRAALLRALEPAVSKAVWWRQPWPWAGLGAVAAAVALVVMLRTGDASRTVQTAQNRPAATAPEPSPVVIETPKQLRHSELAPTRLPARSDKPDRAVDSRAAAVAQPTPPPPPPVIQPAAPEPERSDSSSAQVRARAWKDRAEYDRARENVSSGGGAAAAPTLPSAGKKEAVAGAVAESQGVMTRLSSGAAPSVDEPFAITLSYRAEDGAWRAVDLNSAVPAHRPLRLQVTSAQSGRLTLVPPIAAERTLLAGIPAEFTLPAQDAGTLRLRLTLDPRVLRMMGRSATQTAAPARPLLTREILLKVE